MSTDVVGKLSGVHEIIWDAISENVPSVVRSAKILISLHIRGGWLESSLWRNLDSQGCKVYLCGQCRLWSLRRCAGWYVGRTCQKDICSRSGSFLKYVGSICFVVKICVHLFWKINIRLNWQLVVHNVLASTLKYYMYSFFDSKDK